jgi:hypothetical protein
MRGQLCTVLAAWHPSPGLWEQCGNSETVKVKQFVDSHDVELWCCGRIVIRLPKVFLMEFDAAQRPHCPKCEMRMNGPYAPPVAPVLLRQDLPHLV